MQKKRNARMSIALLLCDDISAGNAQDAFFLHCQNDYRAESWYTRSIFEKIFSQV